MSRHRCHFHPSRVARVSCRTCGHWLCDRCTSVWRGRVYCSRTCLARGLLEEWSTAAWSLLRRPVPPPWALGVVGAAVAALLTVTAVLAGRLLSEARPETPPAAPSLQLAQSEVEGTLITKDGRIALEVRGMAGAGVLVTVDGTPLEVVVLDGRGTATVRDLPTGTTSGDVRLYALGAGSAIRSVRREEPAAPVPSPTPTVTPTASPTPTATATPTVTPPPEPTATPVPVIPSPSPVVSPTPIVVRPLRLSRVPEMRPAPSPTPRPVHRAPPSRPIAVKDRLPDLHLVPDAGPRIALTFDGGSTADGTTELLELLRHLDLKVTLFVTGQFIQKHSGLMRRAVLDGHEVGNHTFSHPHLTSYARDRRHRLLPRVTRSWFRQELLRTEKLFRKATGREMVPYWRAPYGEENGTLRAWAYELGYIHVRWSSLRGASLDSRDWVDDEHSTLYEDSNRMMRRLLRFPHLAGGIVLMHLSTHREEPPWQVLPPMLEALDERGIRATSVTGLLEASPTWRPRLREARRRCQERR